MITLLDVHGDAGPGPTVPPAIDVTRIVQGRATGRAYRLADAPGHAAVRLCDGRLDLLQRHPRLAGRLVVAAAALPPLSRLVTAWRALRLDWTAYEGKGDHVRLVGFMPLRQYASGSATPTRIGIDAPDLPQLCRTADDSRAQLPDDQVTVAGSPVRWRLTFGAAEPAGFVVEGPNGVTLVMTRASLLLCRFAIATEGEATAVARLLLRGGYQTGASALRELESDAVAFDVWTVHLIERAAQAAA